MNSNFYVKSPPLIAPGDKPFPPFDRRFSIERRNRNGRAMNRSSIIALLVLAAILGYFLSFGPDSTRKLQSGFYQLISPFLSTGSGLEQQITAMRKGLKTLEELEKENQALRVENRSLKATNQALRDVERD